MVKHLQLNGTIDFAAPEVVFKLLYADDAFAKFYHAEVNRDSNASVSSWTEMDGVTQREITFKPRISKLPSFVQQFLGADVAQATEIQQVRSTGTIFTIHSELAMDAFLVSSGDTVLSPSASAVGGCEVNVKLMVEVRAWMWGLQATIENYVEIQAGVTFKRWLNLARVFCEKMGLEVAQGELFYDVEEEEEHSALLEPSPDPINRPPSRSLRHSMKITRSSSRFLVKAWAAFGIGIVVGLALGLGVLYMRRLRRRRKQIV